MLETIIIYIRKFLNRSATVPFELVILPPSEMEQTGLIVVWWDRGNIYYYRFYLKKRGKTERGSTYENDSRDDEPDHKKRYRCVCVLSKYTLSGSSIWVNTTTDLNCKVPKKLLHSSGDRLNRTVFFVKIKDLTYFYLLLHVLHAYRV